MKEIFSEGFYLPQKTGILPDGSWLVMSPHADDETFGMGGSILMATRAGVQVDVVIVTDGSKGGSGDNLVNTREQEAKTAIQKLGCRKVRAFILAIFRQMVGLNRTCLRRCKVTYG